VIITEQCEHPPEGRRPCKIRMSQRVTGAVDPRPLRIPHAEDPVVGPFTVQMRLLRAPKRRGREVLVDTGIEAHVVSIQMRRCPQQLLVKGPQRRAPVARNVPGRIAPHRQIAPPLLHGQAYKCLNTGKKYPPRRERVLVVQMYFS